METINSLHLYLGEEDQVSVIARGAVMQGCQCNGEMPSIDQVPADYGIEDWVDTNARRDAQARTMNKRLDRNAKPTRRANGNKDRWPHTQTWITYWCTDTLVPLLFSFQFSHCGKERDGHIRYNVWMVGNTFKHCV